MKYTLIWFDNEVEKGRDEMEANSEDEAIKKGFLKYDGNPPGPLVTITRKNSSNRDTFNENIKTYAKGLQDPIENADIINYLGVSYYNKAVK